jgi:hypothetical protein
MLQIDKVENAGQFLDQYEKYYSQALEAMAKNSPVKVEETKRIEIDGHAALQMTMDLSKIGEQAGGAPGGVPRATAAQAIIKSIFGAEGKMTVCLVAVDDHTVVKAVGNPDHVKEMLAALKKPEPNFTADAEVAATTKLLPADSPWIGFISLKGWVATASGLVRQFLPMPPFPEFPKTGVIGVAAKPTADGLETSLVVPKESFEAIGQYTKQIQQLMQKGVGRTPPRPHLLPQNRKLSPVGAKSASLESVCR